MSTKRGTIKKDLNRKSSVKRRRYFTRLKAPKLSARTKWRALIRKVINNLNWIVEKPSVKKDMDIQEKKDETEVVTQYDKFLLFKDANERREEDLLSLAERISAYKTFRKYSFNLRVALLKRARYVSYNKSVVLIRQGMFMNNMYVLVKGSGTVTREVGPDAQQDLTNMREGHLCGEYPLLYDKPSMTTIATDGPSEWLMFNKYNFLLNAKDELKKQYYDIECALRKFSFFDKMSFFEMREYCVSAEIIKVEPGTVLSLLEGTVGLTYFILEGKCSVLQKVAFQKVPHLPYPGYKLHPSQESPDSSAENFIVRTCFLTRRGVVGLGEEACKWVFMTDTESTFMVIPRYMLLKYGRNMVWERLKDQLNNAYPTLDLILKQLNDRKRWSRYKHRLTRSMSRNLSGNDIHNVPLLARCNEFNSDEEDCWLHQIKHSRTPAKLSGVNIKRSIKKLALHPCLKMLADYLPKDETF